MANKLFFDKGDAPCSEPRVLSEVLSKPQLIENFVGLAIRRLDF